MHQNITGVNQNLADNPMIIEQLKLFNVSYTKKSASNIIVS